MQTIVFIALVSLVGSEALTFTNPIIGGYIERSCILKLNQHYYLTVSDSNRTELAVYKSLYQYLTDFRNLESKVIFKAPEGFSELSPNEMVNTEDGGLYLYFHMNGLTGYRVYVVKAKNASDPMGEWGDPIRLLNDWEYSSMDGTVLLHNKKLYFVWTNVSATNSLLIAPMSSPTWVGNPKVVLREPTESWECQGRCASEAASFISFRNKSHMVYSASSSESPDYCLGHMFIQNGSDPLVIDNWRFRNESVFWRNDEEDVYGPGRAKLTLSADGRELWMLYHASFSPVQIEGRRTVRLDKIEWSLDANLSFPRPLGIHQPKQVPRGQNSACEKY